MSTSDMSHSDFASSSGSSSSASSLSALDQLSKALLTKNSQEVLSHCLGLSPLSNVPSLADNTILICFDTESWTSNHSAITEIGVSTFDSRDMRALATPGLHGEHLLQQMYFYHARIQEHAHLLNIKFCVGNPDANRFGQTRFLKKEQARGMLKEMFAWPIDAEKPELGFCPVVVMGHALHGDMDLLRSALGFDADALGTVVSVIDTQVLARECGFTLRKQIGLRDLVGLCGFQYRDAHTASNDAAMTLIAAVQMVLPAALKPDDGGLQHVLDRVETASQMQAWSWGDDLYCLRCGNYGHTKDDHGGRKCRAKVKCMHCAASIKEKRRRAAGTHRTEVCITFVLHGPELQDPYESGEDVATRISRLGIGDRG